MKTMDCNFQHWHTGSDKTPQESVNTTFYSHYTLNAYVLKVIKTTLYDCFQFSDI